MDCVKNHRGRWVSFIALLGVAASGCTAGRSHPIVFHPGDSFAERPERVLVVSFDGMRPDTIDATRTPHLQSIRDVGAHTETAQTVYPSITLVSHMSMLTGVGPEKHQVLWNSYVPENGTVGVPTIFELAKKNGLTTAMVVGKDKFRHFERPGTVDFFSLETGDPDEVADEVIRVIEDAKAQLIFVHFRHADSIGHEKGWMSEDQLKAIHDEDRAFGNILGELSGQGLLRSTALIVSADHGGHELTHGTDAVSDMTIPWSAIGAGVTVQGAMTNTVTTYDTAATVAALLGLEVPAEWGWKGVNALAPVPVEAAPAAN